MVLEVRLRRRVAGPGDARWIGAAFASMAVAFTIWNLSKDGRPLCHPDSLLQGHAAWHLLCAVAAYCLYRYWVSEGRSQETLDFVACRDLGPESGQSWTRPPCAGLAHWLDHALQLPTFVEASLVGEVPGTPELVRERRRPALPGGLTNWWELPPRPEQTAGTSTSWFSGGGT